MMIIRTKKISVFCFLLSFLFFAQSFVFGQESSCPKTFDKKSSSTVQTDASIKSVADKENALERKNQLKNIALANGYIHFHPLSIKNLDKIRQFLNLEHNIGAATIALDSPFNLQTARRIRRAIHKNILEQNKDNVSFGNFGKRDAFNINLSWKRYIEWPLLNSGEISATELAVFKEQALRFVDQMKEFVLQLDGREVRLMQFTLFTEQHRNLLSGHRHEGLRDVNAWITVTYPIIGLGTWFNTRIEKPTNNAPFGGRYTTYRRTEKAIVLPGEMLILSEPERNLQLSRDLELTFHGTPGFTYKGERLVLVSVFGI